MLCVATETVCVDGRSLFKGVLREMGVAQPAVLPPGQAAEVQGAAAARRRARGSALTGPAAVITGPAQLLAVRVCSAQSQTCFSE